jgi:hypothetical protein
MTEAKALAFNVSVPSDGLQGRETHPQVAGRHGALLEYDAEAQRWAVQLSGRRQDQGARTEPGVDEQGRSSAERPCRFDAVAEKDPGVPTVAAAPSCGKVNYIVYHLPVAAAGGVSRQLRKITVEASLLGAWTVPVPVPMGADPRFEPEISEEDPGERSQQGWAGGWSAAP